METTPASAVQQFREGLAAPLLMKASFFNFRRRLVRKSGLATPNSSIAGALKKVPGDASAGASFAPRVYIRYRISKPRI